MKLISLKDVLQKGKEFVESTMIPIKIKQESMRGQMEMLKIDEQIIGLQTKCQDICAKTPVNFDSLLDTYDEIILLSRRREQFEEVLKELFPEDTNETK